MSVRSDRRWPAKCNTWKWLGRCYHVLGRWIDYVQTAAPLNSRTASNIATRFLMGVPACKLWIELKTNPPPGEDFAPRKHLLADLLRRAKWQSLLSVHTAAPESDPLAK